MSDSNFTYYYRVEPGSEMDAHLVRLNEIHKARIKGINRACKTLGIPHGISPFGSRDRILGFDTKRFETPIPGWKWSKKYGCNVPDLKTPEGKAAQAVLNAIPKDFNNMQESAAIFDHDVVFGTSGPHVCARSAGFWWRNRKGGHVGLVSMHSSVKAAAKKWPSGLVEITASEAEKLTAPKTKKAEPKLKKGEEKLI